MFRNPAVAGLFYPDSPNELHSMIQGYLEGITTSEKVPKAIIAPHAGYMYSGPVAASAYGRLKKARTIIKRVVLMGPSHRVPFYGLALSKAESFMTPLGEVKLDTQALLSISSFPFVEFIDKAHALEHSLEVHLPFLQEVLEDFLLIPIVAGDASPEQVSQVLEKLWGGVETLIVISSDLSHYYDYVTAQKLDSRTTQLIEHLMYRELSSEGACGKVPVSGLLKLLEMKNLQIKNIDLRNSGDTAGDRSRVVGYGAYVVE